MSFPSSRKARQSGNEYLITVIQEARKNGMVGELQWQGQLTHLSSK
jgi:hypothetical protein